MSRPVVRDEVVQYKSEHPDAKDSEVVRNVRRRRGEVLAVLSEMNRRDEALAVSDTEKPGYRYPSPQRAFGALDEDAYKALICAVEDNVAAIAFAFEDIVVASNIDDELERWTAEAIALHRLRLLAEAVASTSAQAEQVAEACLTEAATA